MTKLTRKEITAKLQEATTYYFVKKMYSVHAEFGVERWGRRRLDLLCMNYKGELVGVEIKSCLADYRADSKFHLYLPYVNKLYFCFPPSVVESRTFPEIKKTLRAQNIGIMTLAASGRIRCISGATYTKISKQKKYEFFIKMTWLAGESKRTIKRTKRVYLE